MRIKLLLYILLLGFAKPIFAQQNLSSKAYVNADSVSFMKSDNADLWYVDSSFIERETVFMDKVEPPGEFNFGFINFLMWLLVAGAVGLILYFLINNFSGFEGQKRGKRTSKWKIIRMR